MKINTHDPAQEMSLNLAPMIDVVFLLLIFFMVTTTFAEERTTLDVDLPAAETGETATETPDEITVVLGADGTMRIDGEVVEIERMRELFAQAARANPDTPVTIAGDQDSRLQGTTTIMDVCRQVGLSNVGIMATGAN